MKKSILIIFVFLQLTGKAEYDSTYVLSVTQKYAIPENVANGDEVGIWMKTRTWKSVGKISYSVEKNFNSAFSVNPSSGQITIADASKINGKVVQTDTLINLIIRTTDSGVGSELDTAQIWVKENSYCIFIDYRKEISGDGTKLNPKKDLDELTFTAGFGYFLKRGVKITTEDQTIVRVIGTSMHPTIFAAYGRGAKPEFVGDGTGKKECFFIGSSFDPINQRAEYVYFYDIVVRHYGNTSYKTVRPSKNIGWYNCESYNNSLSTRHPDFDINNQTYADSLSVMPFEFINHYSDTTVDSHIKAGAGPLRVVNGYLHGGRGGVRFACGNDGYIKHSYINPSEEPRGTSGIQVRGDRTVVEDVVIVGGTGKGISITSPGHVSYSTPFDHMPDNCIIRNVFIKNVGAYGIGLVKPDPFNEIPKGNIIEDCTINNAGSHGIVVNSCNGFTIRRTKIANSGDCGLYVYSQNYPILNLNFCYNLVYGSAVTDVYCQNGSNYSIYNNTVDGEINMTDITAETLCNNYFKAMSNAEKASNNLNINTIKTSDHFQDYAGHDYRLKSTAYGSIGKGIKVSRTPDQDIDGTVIPRGTVPDIGAYKFKKQDR